MNLLRQYTPEECGPDGYPYAWHQGDPPIKDLVREAAGHRCVRCKHPYIVGSGYENGGEWSPCDDLCEHRGPLRIAHPCDQMPSPDGGWEPTVWAEVEDHAWGWVPNCPTEARWRILTVHHLTGDKADCRWFNLAALCQRCHLTIQGKVRMEQVYPLPHSEWFRPYAAGYYAATYLGEDLSRQETLERMDELLALEAV